MRGLDCAVPPFPSTMTPLHFILVFSIGAALASALILVPLARLIPLRMMNEFRESVIDNGYLPAPLPEANFAFSLSDKIAICASGCLAGLLAASSYPQMTDAMANGGYLLGVILLVTINLKHQLLPDQVVFTLLWVGLLRGVTSDHGADHVLGAAVGYVAPLVLLHTMRILTGRWLLGYGDLKALAMAGAWFGVAALPLIFAVFAGTVILMLVVEVALKRSSSLPTGAAHFAASLACVLSTVMP